MKTKQKLSVSFILLLAFAGWTAALCLFDRQPIGPRGSVVGFAGLNQWFHRLTGAHWGLYTLTDWLGLVPLAVALGFALLGLRQLIQRRSLLKVDASILTLGAFYGVVIAAYLFFEAVPLNVRPVLIDGFLEASYPSSTTLLTLCVMTTAALQLARRVKNARGKKLLLAVIAVFSVFMVAGRTISGVHWLSDIIGSLLLSAGLSLLYDAVCGMLNEKGLH